MSGENLNQARLIDVDAEYLRESGKPAVVALGESAEFPRAVATIELRED